MKLRKKSFKIIAFLGLTLGITPKTEAISWFDVGAGAAATAMLLWQSRHLWRQSNARPLKQEVNESKQEISPNTNLPASVNLEYLNLASKIIYEKVIDGKNLQVLCDESAESYYPKILHIYFKHALLNYAGCKIYPDSKKGILQILHIEKENRKKNYGALLYACAIKEMIDLGCTKITWSASPHDLLPSQTPEAILPQLINFYQQLGAEVVWTGVSTASMHLTDLEKAREGIYTILEQWESKNTIQINNSPALQRAATIVNHIAPK